uniref:Phospholipid scramblase n=1 Tax=Sinocyclocheilus anshuiensis TaxID=1608454 RepID=A0A671P9N7_9TELE
IQASPSVTTQPLPFGLEREKHIDMLFRTFHRQIIPTADLTPVLQDTGRTRGEDGGHGWKETDDDSKRLGKLSVLRTITRLHTTARPELQESSCMCMHCCGPARSYSLQGFDKDAECVFLFERPLKAEMCWLGCCLMEIRAYTPERELIGTVHQRWSMFTPHFEVCDFEGISAVRIQGSCCNTRCLSEQELQVVSSIGESIGRIWKRWPGYNEELPQGMNLNTKVLLLAAAFLLVSCQPHTDAAILFICNSFIVYLLLFAESYVFLR